MQRRDKTLFLKDASAGLFVELLQSQSVAPGDQLEVVGFPVNGGRASSLQNAIFRQTGVVPPPAPRPVSARQARSGGFDSELVEIKGRLIDVAQGADFPVLTLQTGGTIFEAPLPNTNSLARVLRLAPGSVLRLTGICSLPPDDASTAGPRTFRILLGSIGDITVLQRPPWWTLRHALTLAGFMAALILASLLWVAPADSWCPIHRIHPTSTGRPRIRCSI